MARPARRWWPLAAVAAALATGLVAWSLAGLEIDRTPIPAAGRANLEALGPMWIAALVCWLALSILGWRIVRERVAGGAAAFVIVVAIAAIARVAVVLTHQPCLSDDLYRYVLDGRTLASGHNPHLDTPADRLGVDAELLERPIAVLEGIGTSATVTERWSGEAELLPLVNNPELHTIYLPVSEWVFGATGLAIGVSAEGAGRAFELAVFRLVFVAFDLATVCLVLGLLVHHRASPWWAALYAWHPLPLIETAGSGHQDAIGIFLLVAAVAIWTWAARRTWAWTALVALATLVKPVALPAAAVFLRGRGWRAWVLSLAVGVVVCLAVAAPLWFAEGGEPLRNLMATTQRFSLKWAHFGSVYEPVLWGVERALPADEATGWTNDRQEAIARVVCLLGLAAVVIGAWMARWRCERTLVAILFAMVLFSTTSHPWYLLWALALLPLAFSWAVWIASLTLLLGYAVLGDVVEWSVPAWIVVVAYLPVYAGIAVDLRRARQAGAASK